MQCGSLRTRYMREVLVKANIEIWRPRSTGSSHQWLSRQRKDKYVKQAKSDNWRCRSAYKLLQINERYNILAPGHVVIDCGAAPGSWCQVAVQKVKADEGQGLVIGIDLLPMRPIAGAVLLDQSDFTTPETQRRLLTILGTDKMADLVMSDMAPNASGVRDLDQDRLIEMCDSVLRFSRAVLRDGGTVLCKLWEGAQRTKFEDRVREHFGKVKVVKPDASRNDSAEIYVLGRGYKKKF